MITDHIRIDVGRDKTKVSCIASEFAFKSKVGEWREVSTVEEDNLFQKKEDKYRIEIVSPYFNCKCFVDQLAEESYFEREMATESKIHEETKILFLTAAALAKHSEDYSLGTLVPVSQHNSAIKMQMLNLLCGSYDVTVNGVTKQIIVSADDFDIVAEGAAALWDSVLDEEGRIVDDFLTGQTARFLEIGSKTINIGTIRNKKFLGKRSNTLQYGTLELENAGEITDQTKSQFARKILADVSKVWLDYKKTDLVFLAGGGLLLLGNYIKELFQVKRTAPDVFANARGARKMRLYKDAQKKAKTSVL